MFVCHLYKQYLSWKAVRHIYIYIYINKGKKSWINVQIQDENTCSTIQGTYRGHRMQSWWPEDWSFIWVGPCWTGGWRGVVLSLEAWIAYSYRVMRNLHNLTSAGAAFCGKSCSEGIEHRGAPPPAFRPSSATPICASISSFTQMSHDRGSLDSRPQTNKHM